MGIVFGGASARDRLGLNQIHLDGRRTCLRKPQIRVLRANVVGVRVSGAFGILDMV